jgi:DNA polymerase delta subunit 2
VQCTVNEVGDLVASRIFLPSTSIRVAEPVDTQTALADATYTAFVSDLSVGRSDLLAHQQCVAFLQGALGGAADAQVAARVGQVVVLGNTVSSASGSTSASTVELSAELKAAYEPAFAAGSLHMVGTALAEVASACPVTVLPGSQDPSNHMIPQQPFHQCLFPLASTYQSFNSITNPGMVTIADKTVLMTDGHNVSDMVRLSSMSPLAALTLSLQARLIAPTAPDTYGCYPYKEYDPLVVNDVPAIYAAGGQPRAEWREVVVGNSKLDALPSNQTEKKCLILCVPSFSKTKQILLVNSKTNEVMTVSFEGIDEINHDEELSSTMKD